MGFMYSYKGLDKLCREILGCSDNESGITAYINEMYAVANGKALVKDWEYDLKQLKHYRWIRNQIAHDPDCTEASMCVRGDEQWLENFRSRIMSVNDPLALYKKSLNAHSGCRSPKTSVPPRNATRGKSLSCPNGNGSKRVNSGNGRSGGELRRCLVWLMSILVIYAIIRIICFFPF